MKIQLVICGSYAENCWIAGNDKNVVIIDPGDEAHKIIKAVGDRKVDYILNTHLHIDHIGAITELRNLYKCPFGVYKDEAPALKDPSKNLSYFTGSAISINDADLYLNDNQELDFLDTKIKVLHTPGHTPGGCCFVIGKAIFTGDTLFNMSIGRTDFPGGSYEQIIKSIKNKLMVYDDSYEVFPGHMDKSTIGFERKNNPFLR